MATPALLSFDPTLIKEFRSNIFSSLTGVPRQRVVLKAVGGDFVANSSG